jgi:hypothetical protein
MLQRQRLGNIDEILGRMTVVDKLPIEITIFTVIEYLLSFD